MSNTQQLKSNSNQIIALSSLKMEKTDSKYSIKLSKAQGREEN